MIMTLHSYKGLMFILDGLGDRPVQELQGKTPLEAAKTPNLDELLQRGMGGFMDPLTPGVPVDTHTGTALLTGVSLRDAQFLRRGPIEAAGAGVALQVGDVAIRCNFATIEKNGQEFLIKDRRAGRLRETEVAELAQSLQQIDLGDGICGSIQPATQHRAILHLRGPELSGAVTDSDPMSGTRLRIQKVVPSDLHDIRAIRTAEAVNRFTRIALTQLPEHPFNGRRRKAGKLEANGVICRGAGEIFELDNLLHYLNLKAALITGDCTIAGLGRLLKHTVYSSPAFTALADTDIEAKIQAGLSALDNHEIAFVHLKGPDICSHDFNPIGKKDFLERFDLALGDILKQDLVIGITGDHSTDSAQGEHCGDPVPSLIASPRGRRDLCREFGETGCCRGALGRINANSFLISMLDAMGVLHNYRPEDTKYYPI
jgi:2,3-bisphosphoglycerate-independent phosphoglycerate mutase